MAVQQVKINSNLDVHSTASDVLRGINLSGKLAVVTGGYSGLGLKATRALVDAGADVIVAARRPQEAVRQLRDIRGVEIAALELSDPASIDAFADSVVSGGRPVDILLNAAGVMAAPLTRDSRGYEAQFSVNHLGHFHLTARLWPALCRAGGARVVSVSSRAHQIAPVDFDDLMFERHAYERWQAYAQSKTANALFAVALDSFGRAHGVRAFSVHPGSAYTSLSRHLSDDDLRAFGVDPNEPEQPPPGQSISEGGDFRSPEQAAATIVWCATSRQLDGLGGRYCENLNVASEMSAEAPFGNGVRPWATDPELAESLWRMSEQLTGVKF